MNIKVTFKNDERKTILRYLQAKAAKAQAEKEEKDAKAAAKAIFIKFGDSYKQTDKTAYAFGSVQSKGQPLYVVYKETVAKGAIDWESYAKALGGTDEGAEKYRKANNVRTSLEWATDKQTAEINGEQVDQ